MDNMHHKMFIQIGLNILYYRKEQGITQQALAEMASFSRNHIQKIETAKATPSIEALLDIAEALGIPIGKLFEFRS